MCVWKTKMKNFEFQRETKPSVKRTLLTGLVRPYAPGTCEHCWSWAASIWRIHRDLRKPAIGHCV